MSDIRLTAKGERWMRNAYMAWTVAKGVLLAGVLFALIGFAGWIETGGN